MPDVERTSDVLDDVVQTTYLVVVTSLRDDLSVVSLGCSHNEDRRKNLTPVTQGDSNNYFGEVRKGFIVHDQNLCRALTRLFWN